MTVVRVAAFVTFAAILASGPAGAQTTEPAPDTWSFYASAYTYFVADDENYVQPTITADRDWLHLEARMNYEDLDTGSVWAGYNFSVGDELALEITPLIGVVFGNTAGLAPGYKGALSWRRIELSSETQYVFDASDSAESFLYTWSELTVAPAEAWRIGIVVQRTKVYETEFDIQRGLLAGFTYRQVDVTGHIFNPDEDAIVVIAIGVSF